MGPSPRLQRPDDALQVAAEVGELESTRTPNAASLAAITELAATGRLVPHVSATFPLDKAGEAHRQLETGVQGKVVLLP